jgi:hypothetical protein
VDGGGRRAPGWATLTWWTVAVGGCPGGFFVLVPKEAACAMEGGFFVPNEPACAMEGFFFRSTREERARRSTVDGAADEDEASVESVTGRRGSASQ